MENNIIEFKFDTFSHYDDCEFSEIIKHYDKVINDYLKALKSDKSITISVYNLSSTGNNLEFGKSIERYSDLGNTLTGNNNLKIVGKLKNNIDKDLKTNLFSFSIYSQNNCCGAMTCSHTYINGSYDNNKLATLLQYLKQDIAIYQKVSLLICTDIYNKETNKKDLNNLDNLTPYLPNTKVLLNTGWKVLKLFHNIKSNNTVALYHKDIPKCSYENDFKVTYKNNIILKLKLNNNNDLLQKIEDVTIGCDPELFFKDKDSGEYVPSFYVMKGDKNNPVKITKEGHSIQCDNVMCEYGIPPCKTAEEFVSHNLLVQSYIKNKIAKPNNLEMVIFPAIEFTKANLKDPKAQHMGCDPDYSAWSQGKPNPIVRATSNLRTGAGHIHIGYKDHNFITNIQLVKFLDLYLSIPLLLIEPDNERKTMYGKAGAFRHQPWGKLN